MFLPFSDPGGANQMGATGTQSKQEVERSRSNYSPVCALPGEEITGEEERREVKSDQKFSFDSNGSSSPEEEPLMSLV